MHLQEPIDAAWCRAWARPPWTERSIPGSKSDAGPPTLVCPIGFTFSVPFDEGEAYQLYLMGRYRWKRYKWTRLR